MSGHDSDAADDLGQVPLEELIKRAKAIPDKRKLLLSRGALLEELYYRRNQSWREIQAATGWPQGSCRRWLAEYEQMRGSSE